MTYPLTSGVVVVLRPFEQPRPAFANLDAVAVMNCLAEQALDAFDSVAHMFLLFLNVQNFHLSGIDLVRRKTEIEPRFLFKINFRKEHDYESDH